MTCILELYCQVCTHILLAITVVPLYIANTLLLDLFIAMLEVLNPGSHTVKVGMFSCHQDLAE
jgi:hypothetical protein